MRYIHEDLLKNLFTGGFDKRRPRPGFAINYKCPKKIEELIRYNEDLGRGSNWHPPIFNTAVKRATLAGSHLTMAFRILKCKSNGYEVPADDTDLKYVIEQGHSYILLNEDLPEEGALLLSE